MIRLWSCGLLGSVLLNALPWQAGTAAEQQAGDGDVYDVVVYGGTAAGVAAAVQARRMGCGVVLIEPTRRFGGLTSGGLGQTDIGNKTAIGGLSRQFYRDVLAHYRDPAAWKWQRREHYRDGGQTQTAKCEDAMWTFEPSVARKIFGAWIETNRIGVVYGERLDRASGVALTRSVPWRILSVRMESGRVFRGKVFIDATYEGDLMAAAKVSYTVGREANALYGETLNGVQTAQAKYHQFAAGVDPYVEKGKPASGLLPFLDPKGPGPEGSGDHRVQAYCYRMCLTDKPENRIPFGRPEGYDPQWYELLLRNFEAGESGMPWINSAMPNCKTDTNNRTAFSTDFIGQNYDYPDASYAEREKIAARHRLYQQGLMWTLREKSATKAMWRWASPRRIRWATARSCPKRGSAPTCWSPSAFPPPTSRTARSAWSRSSWCWDSRPLRPRRWRSGKTWPFRMWTKRNCVTGCWPTGRFWHGNRRPPSPFKRQNKINRAVPFS